VRASISDVLMFRKCPRLWQLAQKWDPANKSIALQAGTEIHKNFEYFFRGGAAPPSISNAIGFEGLRQFMEFNKMIEVESSYELDFRGHTVLCRPDAVSEFKTDNGLWSVQIKSAARNLPAHADIVHWSPHEALYQLAIQTKYGRSPRGTILFRYIKTTQPQIKINVLHYDLTRQIKILNSVEETLTDMERYATERPEAPMYTNSCWDWITGAACPFTPVCHNDANPKDFFGPAVNRYPEFAGGSGQGNNGMPSVHTGFDKLDTPDYVPEG